MSKKFEAGQEVYSERGERAENVTASGDGHIVRPIVESYDDEYGEGYDHVCDPVVWRHVFPEEPVAKFSAELKTLHEQIAAAKAERAKIESEDYQRQRERAEKLKRFAVLDNLEAFIDGKITHYVQQEYYGPPKIVAIEQCKADGRDYRSNLRLLTLSGCLDSRGINWTLNQYADGSGSASAVTPCTSYEQAVELVRAAVASHFAHKRSSCEARQDWMDKAQDFDIAVPDEYRRAVVQARIQAIEQNMGYRRQQAQSYADEVAKNDAELAQLRAYLETPAGAA